MEDVRFPQTARAVLMVRPAGFGFNEETAPTNAFQIHPSRGVAARVHADALKEFDAFTGALRAAGVDVIVFQDRPEPHTPDAVFPNNWISFHTGGTVVLYPMCAPSRRAEQREDLINDLNERYRFDIDQIIDLRAHERKGKFLEGTGSVVFDHPNRCGYASISERTHPDLAEELLSRLGYDCVLFRATDPTGQAVYHTNVVMSIGTDFSVIAAEAIAEGGERAQIVGRLEESGRRVIQIGVAQMRRFAANILEVEALNGERVIAMSTAAHDAFEPLQLEALAASARIVSAPLPTIEAVGGGSARCMLAEIFLDRRPQGMAHNPRR